MARWRCPSSIDSRLVPDNPDAVRHVPAADDAVETRRLLVYLAAALLAGGQPVHEVEEQIRVVGRRMGHDGVQVSASPSAVVLSLGGGGAATVESIDGGLRLDQTAEANAIAAGLRDHTLSRGQALTRLIDLRRRPHLYSSLGLHLGHLIGAVGIALVLQPSRASVAFAAVCSPIVSVLMRVAAQRRLVATLLPSIAALLVSLLAFAGFRAGILASPMRTLLPPLAVLFPGALIVTGLAELAAGAMVAGSARLAYGTTQLVLFAVGVCAAAVVLQVPPEALENTRVDELGVWAPAVGLVVLTIGMSLMESVRPALVPWILLTITATYAAQVLGQALVPAAWLGALLGATTASLGATAVEMVRPSLPRIVVFLPAFWLLVPGSLGLVSVTQLGLEPELAAATIATSTSIICATALGLLVGASIARSLGLVLRPLRSRLR